MSQTTSLIRLLSRRVAWPKNVAARFSRPVICSLYLSASTTSAFLVTRRTSCELFARYNLLPIGFRRFTPFRRRKSCLVRTTSRKSLTLPRSFLTHVARIWLLFPLHLVDPVDFALTLFRHLSLLPFQPRRRREAARERLLSLHKALFLSRLLLPTRLQVPDRLLLLRLQVLDRKGSPQSEGSLSVYYFLTN